MKGFSLRFTIPQILFCAAFAATVLTVSSSSAAEESGVIKFAFAFLVFMTGVGIAKLIFKVETENRCATKKRNVD